MSEMSTEYRAKMSLGAEKLRELKFQGLVVVDARRLELLENLYSAALDTIVEGNRKLLFSVAQLCRSEATADE